MDTAQTPHGEDPLIVALPPATDYITYLTLLEYQLNTSNLSTLNRLLSADDGTLAAEIGWDLIKLVLPMLQLIPEEANRCLELIARRGNPREVIIRVAEEFERLGQDDASDEEDGDDLSEPSKFAHEVEGIHLGEMKLGTASKEAPQEVEVKAGHEDDDSDARSGSDDELLLIALLSMLSILHTRIKTEFPSRFLATSLPAALGAYRRLPITNDTTSAFITFLGKLSGKQRPALPPRTSTSGSAASLLVSAAASSSSAPLPDPEAETEKPLLGNSPSENEKAVIKRLLQAVMLEVLDEYTSSFLEHDVVQMQWTSRQRENEEPEKVVPRRSTAVLQWSSISDLKVRDMLMQRFLRLGKDFNLQASKELTKLADTDLQGVHPSKDESEAEYPQVPSDVPFPISGLVILAAAQQFYQGSVDHPPALELAVHLLGHSSLWAASHSPVTTDSILFLAYAAIQCSVVADVSGLNIPDVIDQLTDIFVSNPDPSTRDNAHHVATLLFHQYATPADKLACVKKLLQLGSEFRDTSALISVQTGNLKSIAINWLKDEFVGLRPASEPISSRVGHPIELNPGIFLTDVELSHLVFPDLPQVPGPFISSHPPNSDHAASMSSESDLEKFLLHLPFYTSSLNLITVLSSFSVRESHDLEHQTSSVNESPVQSEGASIAVLLSPRPTSQPGSEEHETYLLSGDLHKAATRFAKTLGEWHKGLLMLLSAKQDDAKADNGPVNMSDVFALEDAVTRAIASLKGLEQNS